MHFIGELISELFSDAFVFRWLHVWFGMIWLGTLYYFNFMQMPFMADPVTEAAAKSRLTRTLLPRALWWFRWGAMGVFVTGAYMWHLKYLPTMGVYWTSAGGLPITIGILLGTLMFLNVWLIIWPAQKIVIANAHAVADGKTTDPTAPRRAARAAVASRTNTMFSIPLLFFMLTGSHYSYRTENANSSFYGILLLIFAIILAVEANAIFGKMLKPLATISNVITSGFVLWFLLYLLSRASGVA